jgi:deoxyribonuclease-1-like protein
MKRKYLLFILYLVLTSSFCCAQATLSVLSWNLKDLGISKSATDIGMIARIVEPYDIVAIQEVVAGPGGPAAVRRLVNELNRGRLKWKFEISGVTSGTSVHKAERYAFLWQDSRVSRSDNGWLDRYYEGQIEREPFYCRGKNGDPGEFSCHYQICPSGNRGQVFQVSSRAVPGGQFDFLRRL